MEKANVEFCGADCSSSQGTFLSLFPLTLKQLNTLRTTGNDSGLRADVEPRGVLNQQTPVFWAVNQHAATFKNCSQSRGGLHRSPSIHVLLLLLCWRVCVCLSVWPSLNHPLTTTTGQEDSRTHGFSLTAHVIGFKAIWRQRLPRAAISGSFIGCDNCISD